MCTTNQPTLPMVETRRVGCVASVAMDGAAPDLERDAPWREERNSHAESYTHVALALN